MTGLIGKYRQLLRDKRGVTAIEFGILALPFSVLVLGGVDVAHQAYANAIIQGALTDAARRAAVEDPVFHAAGDTLEERVEAAIATQVDPVLPGAEYDLQVSNFFEFSGIGRPEKLVTDRDGNGMYDEEDGDCFEDLNENGDFDLDAGRDGIGGGSDVVFYRIRVTAPRLVPMAGLIGLPEDLELNADMAIRNQPYEEGDAAHVICGGVS